MRSIYIHVPFCNQICSYCDFPKMLHHQPFVDEYLKNLKKEMRQYYLKDVIKTIYIGGGTPTALSDDDFEKVLKLTKVFSKTHDIEFTIEANPLDLTINKINLLQKYGVNRVSLGIQTFNEHHLKKLGRNYNYERVKLVIDNLRNHQINNINIDLIYAIPGQTIEDLKKDLDLVMTLKPEHVATYSLLIEPHTKLYINETHRVDEELDLAMYNLIRIYLKGKGYQHYEVSNFAKKGYQSRHNLTYWLNNEYYGFGLGACGYLNNMRIDNTKNFSSYIAGDYRAQMHHVTAHEAMSYDMILGLRLIEGVDKQQFYQRHHMNIDDVFDTSDLQETEHNLKIPLDQIYLANNILEKFL